MAFNERDARAKAGTTGRRYKTGGPATDGEEIIRGTGHGNGSRGRRRGIWNVFRDPRIASVRRLTPSQYGATEKSSRGLMQ